MIPIRPVACLTLRGEANPDPSCSAVVPCASINSWSLVSGPANVTFSNPKQLVTTSTFTSSGDYVLRLTMNHCQGTVYDDIKIHVQCNAPPTVTPSGPAQVAYSIAASLGGTVTDDGYPGAPLTIAWSKIEGPGTVWFDQVQPNNAILREARFGAPGKYRLRLSASDSLSSASADLLIEVTKANAAPVIQPLAAQTIILPDRAYLLGKVTDDGVPYNQSISLSWTNQTGPTGGIATFSNPTGAETMVDFNMHGVYTLRLTANDSATASTSDVVITVLDAASPRFFPNTDFYSTGIGGMRGAKSFTSPRELQPGGGTGTITVTGLSGKITKALIYWHGPTDSKNLEANAVVFVNGKCVVGSNIGVSQNNGWPIKGDLIEHERINSHGVGATIETLLVHRTGLPRGGSRHQPAERVLRSEVLGKPSALSFARLAR